MSPDLVRLLEGSESVQIVRVSCELGAYGLQSGAIRNSIPVRKHVGEAGWLFTHLCDVGFEASRPRRCGLGFGMVNSQTGPQAGEPRPRLHQQPRAHKV